MKVQRVLKGGEKYMNLELTVQDLDQAGKQAVAFNRACNAGADVSVKLSQVIESLRNNWIANDATVHINNLIDLHTVLYDIAHASIQNSCDTIQVIRAMQVTIQNNGGKAPTIGSAEVTSAPRDTREIDRVPDTTANICTNAAADDYLKLQNVQSLFTSFVDQYNAKYNDLMANWTEGGNIEAFRDLHSKLNQNVESFNQILDQAVKNLNTALKNIAGLNVGGGPGVQ